MHSPAKQGALPKLLQSAIDSLHHPDLRRKLAFTFMILVIFRFMAAIPTPGVDIDQLQEIIDGNDLFGMLNMFSGGALGNLGIVALGVYPYITASIIMQLLVPIIPRLQALSREGEEGRNKINQYTHWIMVPLAMFQGYGQLTIINRLYGTSENPIIEHVGLTGSDFLPTLSMLVTFTAGTVFLVWLGELITERGIGNGISIIIFGGIVAGMPAQIYRNNEMFGIMDVVLLVLLMVGITYFIVFVTEAHRNIPVQYSRSTFKGGRVYRQSGGTHIPLRVNSTGMIPLIFAMALMVFPGTVASYFAGPQGDSSIANFVYEDLFNPGGDFWWVYWGCYFLLVVGFTLFYGMIIFQQQNMSENLQKQGGFIPGIRPGKPTSTYLDGVQGRLAWGGAFFLGIIAIMPLAGVVIVGGSSMDQVQSILVLGSAGLLIVVGVVLDTMRQMEAQLLMRHYEGFIK